MTRKQIATAAKRPSKTTRTTRKSRKAAKAKRDILVEDVPAPVVVLVVDAENAAPPAELPGRTLAPDPEPDPVLDLLRRAKQLPQTPELAQMVDAVAYALAGKPIRPGSPHTLESRIARLQALVDAS